METRETDVANVPPKPDPPPNIILRTGLKVPRTATVRREDLFPPAPTAKK